MLNYCEAQARVRQGSAKPLPRAYIKVGCHPPPTTTQTFNLTNGHEVLRWARWRKGEVCRVTMGHLRVTIGHLRLTIGYLNATVVHIQVTIGYFFL